MGGARDEDHELRVVRAKRRVAAYTAACSCGGWADTQATPGDAVETWPAHLVVMGVIKEAE